MQTPIKNEQILKQENSDQSPIFNYPKVKQEPASSDKSLTRLSLNTPKSKDLTQHSLSIKYPQTTQNNKNNIIYNQQPLTSSQIMEQNITNTAKSGNIQMQFFMKTKAGCTVNKQLKTNQDSTLICPKLLEDQNYIFFAVADGHGINGHLVSGNMKKNLPRNLLRFLKQQNNENGIKTSIQMAFYTTNQEIFAQDYDCNLSGSTLVSVLIHEGKLYCANVGDSRAIIGKYDKFQYQAFPLSTDQKPSLEREKQRVIKQGGRIEKQKDYNGHPIGPLRVWLPNIEMPGLAMTRSFGDKIGVQAGVIAEPEILEYQLTTDDKFMILASDGVFEYLTNQEVIQIVQPYYEKGQIEQCAEKLIVESTNAWKRESFARDDITAIVVFFK